MSEERSKRKVKTVITVLSILVVLSIGALATRILFLRLSADKSDTAVVRDNVIGEGTGAEGTLDSGTVDDSPNKSGRARGKGEYAEIDIYKGHPSDSERFYSQNMLPGDSNVRQFAVKLNHNLNVDLYFSVNVTRQTKSLADVMNIKITRLESGAVLYDGAVSEMKADGYYETFSASKDTETVAYYEIEISMPTWAGNEYQASELWADFVWSVKDSGPLTSPGTGVAAYAAVFGILTLGSAAMIVILLAVKLRKRKEDGNED